MKSKSFLRLCLAFVCTLLLLFSLPPPAAAQSVGRPQVFLAISNAVTLNHQSSNLVNAAAVDINPEVGIAVSAYVAGTNATTSQVGLGFATSLDGTNYSTTVTHWHLLTLNGTTAVRSYTNFPVAGLDNARKFKLLTVTNGHTASIFLTNVQFGLR